MRVSKAEVRVAAARALAAAQEQVAAIKVFAGLDGFVDEIVHVVDLRQGAESYTRLSHITAFAQRVAEAAGKSTNIEMVNQRVKLGGNGPILANALAALGPAVTYLGALGYPNIHPVFEPLRHRAEVHSICDHGHTQALEFEDGKIMLAKTTALNEVTWANIEKRFGEEAFVRAFQDSNLVTFVNWTMVPQMSELWKHCLLNYAPRLTGPRRMMFFDLADPAKRTKGDILEALALMRQFENHFSVTLGLNEKEAVEVADCFGIPRTNDTQAALLDMGAELYARLGLANLVIHPGQYAFVVHREGIDLAYGPAISKALITTGAGDHFNAGFCLGKLLNLPPAHSISLGVATSGYYVKNGATPSLLDLISFLEQYPITPAEEAAN